MGEKKKPNDVGRNKFSKIYSTQMESARRNCYYFYYYENNMKSERRNNNEKVFRKTNLNLPDMNIRRRLNIFYIRDRRFVLFLLL